MDVPLCRMCFLFSHAYRIVTGTKQLYLQNEGLSEIFWGAGGFGFN